LNIALKDNRQLLIDGENKDKSGIAFEKDRYETDYD